MFSKLRSVNFWVGVVVVLIAVRWIENMWPQARMITNPGAKTGTASG